MTETQKRITAYKEALPALRERVIAVALLLAMSTAMMVSASFAWLTLSKAPEVKGATTEIAANGNLEIALTGTDGVTEPGKSNVGDSSAAEGQTVYASNVTWGNLVNLSGSAYGLDKIILRPAVLNMQKLGTSPFRSVTYGYDGRVENDQNTKFSYCTWELADGVEITVDSFSVTNEYGVRAIAEVTEEYESNLGGGLTPLAAEYYARLDEAEAGKDDSGKTIGNLAAQEIYLNDVAGNKDGIDALAAVVGLIMDAKLNDSNPEVTSYIPNLNTLYQGFLVAVEAELDAIVRLANVQQLVYTKGTSYIPLTTQSIRNYDEAGLSKLGVHIESWNQFLADLKILERDAAIIDQWATTISTSKAKTVYVDNKLYEDKLDAEGNPVLDAEGNPVQVEVALAERNGIREFLQRLVDVNSCVVHADDVVVEVGSLGMSAALNLIDKKDIAVVMMKGILPRFEQRIGAHVDVENQPITVHVTMSIVTIPKTMEVDIYTQYRDSNESLFNNDLIWTEEQFDESGIFQGKKKLTAGNTYGLAIDLWVRTNGGDENGVSYLILEGQLKYEQATGTDAEGNSVGLLYYYEETDPDTASKSYTYVYEDEDGAWFKDFARHGENTAMTDADLSGKDLQIVYSSAPVGYEGENRVWDEIHRDNLQPPLSEFNTTQGSGSCYTFYADTPQEQQSILNLLSHMYVIFTDGGNTWLATGRFDTEEGSYYAAGGKVTVPLVLNNSKYYYVDADSRRQSAVTELQRNEATRITALIYLDGQTLSNKEALAASDIQGTLNLQFGTNIDLTTAGDRVLQEAERQLIATVETANTDNVLDFFEDDLKAKVTLTIKGDTPASVTAFFQREINSFQGSRQETMIFTKQSGGDAESVWVCEDFAFPAPGKYVLRSVQLDGIDYDLKEFPTVQVEGFSLEDVEVYREGSLILEKETTIITTDNSVRLTLSTDVAVNDPSKAPTSVRVEFLRKADGAVIAVDMNPTTEGWSGNAVFTSSGEYSLSYAYVDGELYDLGSSSKTFTLYLGLSATVDVRPQIVPLEDGTDAATINAFVRIMDNNDDLLENMDGYILRYRADGSGKEVESVLSWNANTRYYEGKFLVTYPGTYRFYYLQSGDNYISTATAGIFRARTNKPVSYEGCTNDGAVLFSLAGDSTAEAPAVLIQLKNSDAAEIVATFQNEAGETFTVDQGIVMSNKEESTGISLWSVPVPKVNDSYAGTWKLTQLSLANVMDSNAVDYTTDKPYVMVLEDAPTIKVISDYVVELSGTDPTYEFNGTFMQTHNVEGLSVKVYYLDGETRKPLPETLSISNVRLTYEHKKDSNVSLGGYTIGTTVMPITVALSNKSTDGMTFTQSTPMSLQVAGTYNLASVKLKIGSTEVEKRSTELVLLLP